MFRDNPAGIWLLTFADAFLFKQHSGGSQPGLPPGDGFAGNWHLTLASSYPFKQHNGGSRP